MQLPKINAPTHTLTLPILKKQIKFRPFLVGEEKILLTAIEGYNSQNVGDSEMLIDAIFQVLQNCILTLDVKVESLSSVDVEWLFLNIRKKSVSETVELMMKHEPDCGHINKAIVNLDEVKVIMPKEDYRKVFITDTIGVIMKYPDMLSTIKLLAQQEGQTSKLMFDLVAASIDVIFENEQYASASEYTHEDLVKWIETFSPQQMEKIYKFFNELPYMSTNIKYTCEKCGQEVSQEVKGTASFFI